jgi:hypothetical protein
MRRDLLTLERIRPTAALLLLAVFLGAAQLVPATHLATHRNDHTHGPAFPAAGSGAAPDDDHAAAHRTGRAHDHGTPVAVAPHDSHAPSAPAPPDDHGRASSAHFDLALLEAPPAPFLPLPAGILARAPGVALHWSHAPPLAHPPVRGPPRLS